MGNYYAKLQKIAVFLVIFMPLLMGRSAAWGKALEVPREFKTISGALEAASYGDEIIVAPGTYKENLILKKGIILRSKGSNDERAGFISASHTIIEAAKVEKQIILGAEGAVLDGFTIKEMQERFELREKNYGVLVNGTAMTIINCLIASLANNGIGIIGPANGKSIIKNNKIYNNRGNGITCEEGVEVDILSCEIYQNGDSGIHNAKKVRVSIKQNIIRQNDVDGVMNSAWAEPVITENEIYQNGLNGIGLQLFSKGRIINNKIKSNRQAGIGLRMNAECIIQNNIISGNRIGIGLMDIGRVEIEGNKITENNMVGVGLMNCQGGKVILRKNDLRGNRLLPISPNRACELIEEDNQT